MRKQDFVVISVESQKGGVGKTTVALNLAGLLLRSEKYEVLFIDLDIAGTEAKLAASPRLCQGRSVNTVRFPLPRKNDEDPPRFTENLVDLFATYMTGEEAPRIVWDDAKTTEQARDGAKEPDPGTLQAGDVNVISSYLQSAGREPKSGRDELAYGPTVLFDQAHSGWFMDMIKELVTQVCVTPSKKRLAVVVDTSPGFSGLGPIVQEWLTDMGPERGKMLVVNSMDIQDVVACVRAIDRIEQTYAAKWNAAGAFRDLSHGKSSSVDMLKDDAVDRFFCRLADARDTRPAEVETEDGCLTIEGPLDYYLDVQPKKGHSYLERSDKWWGVLYNRVPAPITSGGYEYDWKRVIGTCSQYGERAKAIAERCNQLFVDHHVPYLDAFSLLFVAETLAKTPFTKPRKRRPPPDASIPEFDSHELAACDLNGKRSRGVDLVLSHMAQAEEIFRRSTARVFAETPQKEGVLRVNWGRFAPMWLFTAVLRSGKGSPVTADRALSVPVPERMDNAHSFLAEGGRELQGEAVAWLDKVRSESAAVYWEMIATYVASTLLAAMALRHSARRSTKLAKREAGAFRRRLRLLTAMGWAIEDLRDRRGVHAEPLTREYWQALSMDRSLVRAAENLVYKKYTKLLANQGRRATDATDEFLAYCKSQLALLSTRTDLLLVRDATEAVTRSSATGAMAALVDRLLEAALLDRERPWETVRDDLASVGGGTVSERKDPVEVLLAMDSMKEFRDVLMPMLRQQRWGLI